ncbi:hypothetical protein [Ekhidna sp.]|uniref:hypothetical protein n=1 Tax=Ekhidna sp. TaxID=2608089 RepID=UPI003CCC2249
MQKTTHLRIISIAIFQCFCLKVSCQESFQWTTDFIQHLNEIEAYEEGIFFIDNQMSKFNGAQSDSLNYYKGYFNYELKRIDQSIRAFEKVRNESHPLFLEAKFLTSFQYAYTEDYSKAKLLIELDLDSNAFYHELKLLELSGIALLERDFETFQAYSKGFTGNYYQLASVEENFKLNHEGLLKTRKKSPLLAGVLSGVVPGAGKFYVGKAGEGYLTLLLSTIAGLQMREAYKKDGINSTRFKVFAGVFGAIYVANIWGSVLSVKVYREEINKTYNEAILLNMHVPLRTIFN